MEEEKAAAYYEELTRKGGGAAKFKQGLGFSSAASTTDTPPSRGSSSFMSSFVKASSPGKSKEFERQSQIESIQNKLKSKNREKSDRNDEIRVRVRVSDRNDEIRVRDRRRSRSRSTSSERRRDRRRYRSSSRERRRDRREKRSRSRSRDRRSRDRSRRRGRSRSLSPRGRKLERGRDDDGVGVGRKGKGVNKDEKGTVDYAKLIHGYDKMTPAERVKAKMKLQLSQTAEKDEKIGVGSQWERFDFDKDAPLEDEVLEAADDDAAVSKRISQSFRFASLEGKREDEVRNAHDEAMFGVPALQPSQTSESENESDNEEKTADDTDAVPASSLLNEKVLSNQHGSWRDRARRKVG